MSKTRLPDLPPVPATCSCGGDVSVTRVEVFHIRTARRLVGVFGEFGITEGKGKHRRPVLRPCFRFGRWIVQCARCFCQTNNSSEATA